MKKGPGTLYNECVRTAEMLPDIHAKNGMYFVVAFLRDSGYGNERMETLFNIMTEQLERSK